jgi:signal transduction histidine kinase
LVPHLVDGCRIDGENGDAILAGDASAPCRLVVPLGIAGSLRLFRRQPLDETERLIVRELAACISVQLENEQLRHEVAEVEHSYRELLIAGGHEVKTPLAALQLQLQGLERQLHRKVLDRDSLESRLNKCCAQLGRVVENLEHLLHAAENSHFVVVSSEVDLAQLSVDVAARHGPHLQKAGCALSVRLQARPIGAWDGTVLERALAALLEHALRHGGGRPVEVVVGSEERLAFISVLDGGPPLPKHPLFSPRAREIWEQHFGSTGLCLWRSRKELSAMGGALSISSRPEGTEYRIELVQ